MECQSRTEAFKNFYSGSVLHFCSEILCQMQCHIFISLDGLSGSVQQMLCNVSG